ncbi:hypothetical protein [Agrobacterium tumefaciens]|uniref:Uncharacterized protein n=1 Tax=Agrobacterium tumefaciens TaxID=358 RepID=A0A176WW65_AGRTU|nr:hypothetical protein [Agrobacterium tumefaciens]OAE37635.1 hypothetical protein A7J57_08640 [Agrobacterium tumefaciens]
MATNVNQLTDIMRQIMAEVRSWYEIPGWIDLGHTPTYVSATVFTVTGDQRTTYEVGRRVRAINNVGTTIYGTITASAYTVTTSVTVSWDSGSLDTNVAEVAVGAASVAGAWIAIQSLKGLGSLAAKSTIATADITDAAVTAVKIANSVLTTAKFAAASIANAAADFVSGASTKFATAGGVFDYIINDLGVKNKAYAENTSQVTLSATPFDGTIPQNTEGTQVLSQTFTPKKTTSRVRISIQSTGDTTSNTPTTVVAALFLNSGSDAIAAKASSTASALGNWWTVSLDFEHVPGVATEVTYTVRLGIGSGGARINGPVNFGGVGKGATMTIEEV